MIEHLKIHTSKSITGVGDIIAITSHDVIYWSWRPRIDGSLSKDELKAIVLDILDRVDIPNVD